MFLKLVTVETKLFLDVSIEGRARENCRAWVNNFNKLTRMSCLLMKGNPV